MPYKDPVVRAQKQKEYSKKWYENNKPKQLEMNRKNKRQARADFAAFKANLRCTKCGENHPATLDFHHHTPHPANRKISSLITDGQYTKAIEEIMEKCIVLCSNCHRKHHWEENKTKYQAEEKRLPEESFGPRQPIG